MPAVCDDCWLDIDSAPGASASGPVVTIHREALAIAEKMQHQVRQR
jgi:hypothetical protein